MRLGTSRRKAARHARRVEAVVHLRAWVSHFGVIVLVLIYAFGRVSSISYEGDLLLAQIALFLGWHTALN